MSLRWAHIGASCALCCVLLGGSISRDAHAADTATQQGTADNPFLDGTYDLSTLGESAAGYVWAPVKEAVLVGQGSYTGTTQVSQGTVQLGDGTKDGIISQKSGIYLSKGNSNLTLNNTSETSFDQVVTGEGSLVFKGASGADITGTVILMNPNPNTGSGKSASTSGGKAIFPTGLTDTPLSGDIVTREGTLNITGSGANTSDLDFVATKDNSMSGSIVDTTTRAVLGTVDARGVPTASGKDEATRLLNAERLKGFVANNDYIIIGQADRGSMTVSNGAVVAADTSTVNVGLAASARGSMLTVDNAWFHAGILSVGNGDSTYDSPHYDPSRAPSTGNGSLSVINGGVVNSTVSVAGNYLGGVGTIKVIGNEDNVGNSSSTQSILAATNFFVNGSGIGTVTVGDDTNKNSGLIAVKNSVAFGVPSQDDLVGANKDNQIVQEQLKQKSGYLNIQTGGTVSVSDPRDTHGNVIADAIYAADNEKSYQFNLNGGTLQRGAYNDTASVMSNLTTGLNISLNKTSYMDTNGGNIVLNGMLSGAGGIIKQSQGNLVFTHHNSFDGDITIEKGSVLLASGSGGEQGDFGNSKLIYLQQKDASVTMSQVGTATFGQTIDGAGSVVQSGDGMTVLTADNSYTGETTINRGNLRINGNQSSATGQTTISSGGTLSGSGTVGGPVIVHDRGTISAGGDDGDLHQNLTIAGTGQRDRDNLIIETGGILNANIGSDKTSEDTHEKGYVYHEGNVLYVTGKARFGEGSIINLSTNPDKTLRYNVGYRVLQTTDGVEGDLSKVKTSKNYLFLNQQVGHEGDSDFSTVVDANGNMIPSGQSNPNAVDVILHRNSVQYNSIATTRNERASANMFEQVGANSDAAQAFAQMTDAGQARHALNALSGEVHASLRTALIQNSFYTRQAVLDRLATADCDGPSSGGVISTADWQTRRRTDGKCVSDRAVWWGQAYGGMGHNDGAAGAASMSHSVAGFIIGADKPLENEWRVGGFVGYAHSMMGVHSRASSGRSDDISIGAYASKQWGAFSLRTGAIYTWNLININRQVDYTGFHDKNNTHQHGGTAQAFAEAAYRFHITDQARIEPFIDMTYVNLHTREFTEGGGQAALHGRGMDTGVGYMTAGVRASTRFWIRDALVSPYAMVAYRRAFGDVSPSVHQTVVSGGPDMDINGAPMSEDSVVADVGVQAQLTDMIDVSLSYFGQYGNRGYDNGGRASIRVHF
ncbi:MULTISPECIES: autotransporter domain-containing protein [unclassified Saccharibacter]|uniref:autotransporter domain-containing protein n=1 Tax=unclassified Saccharibacter TaxID=2648722 RepID=UPI0013225BEA|nr:MULTISPECIES: autotransporter domain-containing protein [unclassified Saccharibacter]MXV36769.1 autotransporter domain-containing protein [Saccharibacter sp. EH611]MXV58261.1 autotransporter domain-containing protein [Saccharibacter sp. EH70]MXV65717.1 autotransporter domain-containing protein [Saccharibacter sp. EH60]